MAKIKLSCGALVLLASCAHAQTAPTETPIPTDLNWLQLTEQQAIDNGVSPDTVHAALDTFTPNPHVIALDQKQPESTITFDAYRHNIITPARIKKGAELMQLYADQLRDIETRTGVPPQIVVALWGIESSFGQNMGDYETVNSLATLAYEGRRADFFRSELFAALHILDQEHLTASQLRGSWAGAMGQCQFMPSTYLKYAADGDNDGRIDIWTHPADVMASIANYLSAEGWKPDLTWGREVKADEVDTSEVGLTVTHTLAEWAAAGVRNADGTALPKRDLSTSLIQPDGANGNGSDGANFLVYDNFRALMRWNRSTYFATSVGLLADQIKGY